MDTIKFQRLLALVNSALWNTLPDESLFSNMNDKSWNDLYRFAVLHGVLAVAYDGVMKLPITHQPSMKIRMAWALSTKHIEDKYEYVFNVANDLSDLFRKEQINMLVFKGLNLSANYPIPSHREFGDIDIYLFGKHEEGNHLLDKVAVKKKGSFHYKHSNYYYKDIMVENHAYLLDVNDSVKIQALNQILLEILENNKTEEKIPKDKLLFPSAEFTALFFIIHAIKHLSTDYLQLRTYCDWALFLKAYENQFNIEKWRNILEKAGLLEIAETLTSLTFRWLEVPADLQFPIRSHPEMEEQISKEMLYPVFYSTCKSEVPWKIFIHKYKRLNSICKRHVTFYGGSLFKHSFYRFYESFIDHLKCPETIFKNQ